MSLHHGLRHIQLPPRSTAGQLTLDQHIGVRIPGGQPKHSKELNYNPQEPTNSASVGKNVGTLKPPCPSHANTLIEHLLAVREDIRKLTRLIRAYLLRPGPGRPRHPKVTLASKMRSQGKSWAKVFTL